MIDRFNTFKDRVSSVIEHNMRSDVTYTKGINAFSDFTFDEQRQDYNIYAAPQAKCSATTHGVGELKRPYYEL